MKGLKLSQCLYEKYYAPMLRDNFGSYLGRIAVGLVGEGSECWGFDDEISRDHDWGATLCFWLTREDFQRIGKDLEQKSESLLQTIIDIPVRNQSAFSKGRSGVFTIGDFYYRHLGYAEGPKSLSDWLRTSEERLAVATNGAIFGDQLGKFSEIRKRLLDFYPEDVRLQKLGARCAQMAQSGQYNVPRCLKRGETVAAVAAEAEFVASACSAFSLLFKRYKPYYKWMHRALCGYPEPCPEVAALLTKIVCLNSSDPAERKQKIDLIEEICVLLVRELQKRKLTDLEENFLLPHAAEIHEKIEDPEIRKIAFFVG